MQCFIYEADIYCETCGQAIRDALDKTGDRPTDWRDESTHDSNEYPQGPFEAGEADYPWHCGGCGLFLENPLTSEGIRYVAEAISEKHGLCTGEWADFYREQLESDSPAVISALYAGAASGPGKFEGEYDWAVYYWDKALNGCQDETQYDPDDEMPIEIFRVSDEDRAIFPELAELAEVWIWEDDQGFVSTRTFGVGEEVPSWEHHHYDVIVGNIGSVMSESTNKIDARAVYDRYVCESRDLPGCRAYKQDVTLIIDGKVECEWTGYPGENNIEPRGYEIG